MADSSVTLIQDYLPGFYSIAINFLQTSLPSFIFKIWCMNYDYAQTDFSRGILSGLFAGLIGCVANSIFVLVYRGITSFYEFNGLDVTVIVFGSVLQLIVCGLVFYFFVHYLRRGIISYRIAVVIITIVIFYLGLMVRRSMFGDVQTNFKALVVGTQIIIGVLAAFLVPYIYRHDKIIS